VDPLSGHPAPPEGLSINPARDGDGAAPAAGEPTDGKPAAGEPGRQSPAMLVLPGGGYERHADHEAEPVAEWLASLGIHAFALR
jgi:hypothetical protein